MKSFRLDQEKKLPNAIPYIHLLVQNIFFKPSPKIQQNYFEKKKSLPFWLEHPSMLPNGEISSDDLIECKT